MIKVANAPCSWGVLEFESKSASPGYAQVLDEMAAAGYSGTELGDWGFMPTDPAVLRAELDRRSLALLGAFVTVRLVQPATYNAARETALGTAQLLAAVESSNSAFIVLSDEPMADPVRAKMAGRIGKAHALTARQWDSAAGGVEEIARAVRDETGLDTVFHHHCAGHVETAGEIHELLERCDPALVGLCLDSGHATYAGASPLELLARYRQRIRHVHLKDCEPRVADAARREEWDYQTALRRGVFCELGRGSVDFPALVHELAGQGYSGWVVVEQDVLPAMGAPFESARRNREFLSRIGL